MRRLLALTFVLVGLPACTPIDYDPTPNPDHGPVSGDRHRDIIFEVHAYDLIDTEVARPVLVTIDGLDAAGRPVDIEDANRPGVKVKRVAFTTRSPFRYTMTVQPGVVSLSFVAIVQGYGGDGCTLEVTDGTGDLATVQDDEVSHASLPRERTAGAMTLSARVFVEP